MIKKKKKKLEVEKGNLCWGKIREVGIIKRNEMGKESNGVCKKRRS